MSRTARWEKEEREGKFASSTRAGLPSLVIFFLPSSDALRYTSPPLQTNAKSSIVPDRRRRLTRRKRELISFLPSLPIASTPCSEPLTPLAFLYPDDGIRMDALLMRFEEPSSMARWDSPLFTVGWDDPSPPFDDIWAAMTSAVKKKANPSVVPVRACPLFLTARFLVAD